MIEIDNSLFATTSFSRSVALTPVTIQLFQLLKTQPNISKEKLVISLGLKPARVIDELIKLRKKLKQQIKVWECNRCKFSHSCGTDGCQIDVWRADTVICKLKMADGKRMSFWRLNVPKHFLPSFYICKG